MASGFPAGQGHRVQALISSLVFKLCHNALYWDFRWPEVVSRLELGLATGAGLHTGIQAYFLHTHTHMQKDL